MEPNEEMNNENTNAVIPETDLPETQQTELPGGRYNLEICPNCLEPNDDDLAVCKYCGQPLTPGAEVVDSAAMPESEQELAANRAAAAAQENKPKKKQESGFRRVMPWLGLYLIYYAVTGVIETAHTEELKDVKLAYLSWVIWFAAGILMSWPLWKKWYRKLRHLPEEDEAEGTPEADQNGEDAGAADDISEETEAEQDEGAAELTDGTSAPETADSGSTEADDGEVLPDGFSGAGSDAAEDTGAESRDADGTGNEEETDTDRLS